MKRHDLCNIIDVSNFPILVAGIFLEYLCKVLACKQAILAEDLVFNYNGAIISLLENKP